MRKKEPNWYFWSCAFLVAYHIFWLVCLYFVVKRLDS